jgi:hypothetical protein
MKVVLTAPIPGVRTPNLPLGEAIFTGLRIQFPPVHANFPAALQITRREASVFRNGCFIGAVNAENKTSYDAATLPFLQTDSVWEESVLR